jgi:uncharacterized membrane protein
MGLDSKPLIIQSEDRGMDSTHFTGQHRTLNSEARAVPIYAPFLWLRDGWRDVRRHWGASLGYGALIMGLGWTLLVFCGTHPYFIAGAISGFLLVGPLMSAGLCEMSRRYSLGQPASFDDSLEGFARSAPALMEFGVILAICAAGWFLISALLLGTVFHVPAPDMSETLYRGFLDMTNRSQVVAYVCVGGILATAVFTVSVTTIPMIVDQSASVGQAMRASVRAVLRNIPAMMVWSALILVLTIIGYGPLLAGMLIIAPVLGHATWYAYADLIARPLAVRPVNAVREDLLMQTGSRRSVPNPNETREGYWRKVRNSTDGLR